MYRRGVNLKRHLRGPVVWIVLVVIAVIAISRVFDAANGYKTVDTAVAIEAINKDQVQKAELFGGASPRIALELKEPAKNKKIQASYLERQGAELANLLQTKTAAGAIPDKYDITNPRQNFFVSLLVTLAVLVHDFADGLNIVTVAFAAGRGRTGG